MLPSHDHRVWQCVLTLQLTHEEQAMSRALQMFRLIRRSISCFAKLCTSATCKLFAPARFAAGDIGCHGNLVCDKMRYCMPSRVAAARCLQRTLWRRCPWGTCRCPWQ
jgi:hypothetical protein